MAAALPKFSTTESLPVWPRVASATKGEHSLVLSRDVPLFLHSTGCCQSMLRDAFERVERLIFSQNQTSALPQLRVRVVGVREDSAAPELKDCAAATSASVAPPEFGSLLVEIAAASPTPLQFGVDESYDLELMSSAGAGGVLRAATEWGALRGIETFTQLVQPWASAAGSPPARRAVLCGLPLTVRDAPAFPWRGLLLDTSRHFLPVRSSLLPVLDAMAAVKLNTLHWHLTDGAAFSFEPASEPHLGQQGALHPSAVYSPGELKAVVAYAHSRGIRIVPELDMPAHTASWAFARPEVVISCPRRVAADEEGLEHGVNKAALNPLKEETYDLIERLLAELGSIFPDEFVHIGGDEVDGDCWLSDPLVAAWARKHRKQNPRIDWKVLLQATFTARVQRIAAQLGKRAVLWDDALEAAQLLPALAESMSGEEARGVDREAGDEARASIVIDVWRDWVRTPRHERRDHALLTGHAVVWSSLAWYLDLPGNTWDHMYNVQLPSPHAGHGAGHPGQGHRHPGQGLLGGETSCWNEHADGFNLQQRVLTRAAAVAERLWSGEPSAVEVARQRLAAMRCRLVRRGLYAAPVIPDHCEMPSESARLPSSTVYDDEARPLSCVEMPPLAPLPPPPPRAPLSEEVASRSDDDLQQTLLGISLALNAALLGVVALMLRRGGGRDDPSRTKQD